MPSPLPAVNSNPQPVVLSLGNTPSTAQFILYKILPSTSRPGKTDKFPCDVTGHVVSAHDAGNWMDAETAYAAASLFGEGWGVGFVFTEADPFWFLDIDSCLVNGAWSSLAVECCTLFAGCLVEVSQSGTGLHIIGSGRPPAHACRNQALGMEFYSSGRFVALTGTNALGSAQHDASAALPAFVAKYFASTESAANESNWTEEPSAEWRGPQDDGDLIRRAMASKSSATAFGGKASFADLWLANVDVLARNYPDEVRAYDASSADAALAQHLAFWTGCDCERVRRIMMLPANGLYRDKYEREDYLQRTILGAVGRQDNVCQDKATYLPAATLAEMASIVTTHPNTEVITLMMQLGTQDSVAAAFVTLYEGKVKFDHSRKRWHLWDGVRWSEDSTKRVFDLVVNLCREKNREGKSSMGSASFAHGVEDIASSRPELSVSGNEWDKDNYLLNTPAGTLDLHTGKLRSHNSDDMITKCTGASPDTASDGAAFRKFMMEITDGDEDLIRFHQVSLGACLSGAIEDHWLQFWTGTGRNGKNTVGELVQYVMGDYAKKIGASTLMSKKFQSHSEEIADLHGCRLAISSELNDGDHWDEARINEVTGDATLSARHMYGTRFQFRRTHKHLIYANYKPQLRSVSDGIRSRLKIVPFKVSFSGREDKNLPERLRAESGYVLQWLIEGHRQWLADGKKLPKCAAVEAESAEYFEKQSTPQLWFKERCEVRDNLADLHLHTVTELYRDYRDWKAARGENPVNKGRWEDQALQGLQKVTTRKGTCVRRLRLLSSFEFQHVMEPDARLIDFATFATEMLSKEVGNCIV